MNKRLNAYVAAEDSRVIVKGKCLKILAMIVTIFSKVYGDFFCDRVFKNWKG